MVLPLFLMAGGAANEYKATLRAEAEAQARLNEAAVTAEHNKNMKRNLKPYGNIDVELRADTGVEVEELTPQRVADILKDTSDNMKNETVKPVEVSEDDKLLAAVVGKVYQDLNESLEAVALDSNDAEMFKVPISELVNKLSAQSGIKCLVLDGIITQRLLDNAKSADIKCIIGHRTANLSKLDGITVKTFTELGIT